MKRFLLAATAAAAAVAAAPVHAQDLTPRAYVITPLRSNAINLSYIFNDGELLFEGTVPITDATGRLNVPAISLYRSLNVFGRSANVSATLPYAVGNFKGTAFGAETSVYRSGLMDSVFRVSVNLVGAPAMELSEMRQRRWQQKQLLGASLKIVAPTGQYDPTKLINLGANRWALKPELGYSGRWGHWVVDAYAAVWFFTRNPEFFSRNQYVPGTQDQTQDPIAAFETHLSYDFKPRLWVSLDGNFWYGGRTSLDGVENPATLQKSSRIGVTASFPVTGHQSIKLGVADGAYVRFGGDYRIVSVAWQYSWLTGSRSEPGVDFSGDDPGRFGQAAALSRRRPRRGRGRFRAAVGPDRGQHSRHHWRSARERDGRAPGAGRAHGAVGRGRLVRVRRAPGGRVRAAGGARRVRPGEPEAPAGGRGSDDGRAEAVGAGLRQGGRHGREVR